MTDAVEKGQHEAGHMMLRLRKGLGESTDGGGLGKARHTLHQHVASGQQSYEESIHQRGLAHHHAAYRLLQALQDFVGILHGILLILPSRLGETLCGQFASEYQTPQRASS